MTRDRHLPLDAGTRRYFRLAFHAGIEISGDMAVVH
jgi:hypothetical protein